MSFDSVNASTEIDQLIAGTFPLVGWSGTASSLIHSASSILHLPRGTVMGKNTGGLLTPCDKDATDGSQTPYGVLAVGAGPFEDDTPVQLYVKGEFNSSALTFADGTTAADIADAALARSIIIRDVAAL